MPAPVDYAPTEYVRTSTFDHSGRPTDLKLPVDPAAPMRPRIGGHLDYSDRGLPTAASVTFGSSASQPIVSDIDYDRDGAVLGVTYGDTRDASGMPRTATRSTTTYDARRRPTRMRTTRAATGAPSMPAPYPLSAVTIVADQILTWDPASNLTRVEDRRIDAEWRPGTRAQTIEVTHDALYRVIGADYYYGESLETGDDYQDWRVDFAQTRAVDPMQQRPAAHVGEVPSTRVANLTWSYDWLGNMTEWTDDASAFYERSLGDTIVNGNSRTDASQYERPSALRFAATLPVAPVTSDLAAVRGGYVELDYGVSGNVTAMTVHAECRDASPSAQCALPSTGDKYALRALANSHCVCADEQHYTYSWDELNRLDEARRFDRHNGAAWTTEAQQWVLYDSGNQRTVKVVHDFATSAEHAALYVYAGDYERRGVDAEYDGGESQWLVGGARVAWTGDDYRVTVPVSDLIHTTSAVMDLATGELVEASTYYPNGARETFVANSDVPPEPMGFTGKEGDEEVGLTYFGERYLIARVGRWASPDPLAVHQAGGGDVGNSFHYMAGGTLQGRDPLGLTPDATFVSTPGANGRVQTSVTVSDTIEVYSPQMPTESDSDYEARLADAATAMQSRMDKTWNVMTVSETKGNEDFLIRFQIRVVVGQDPGARSLVNEPDTRLVDDAELLDAIAQYRGVTIGVIENGATTSFGAWGDVPRLRAPAAQRGGHVYQASVFFVAGNAKADTHEYGHTLGLGEGYGTMTDWSSTPPRSTWGDYPGAQGTPMATGRHQGNNLNAGQSRAILGSVLHARDALRERGPSIEDGLFGPRVDGYRAAELWRSGDWTRIRAPTNSGGAQ